MRFLIPTSSCLFALAVSLLMGVSPALADDQAQKIMTDLAKHLAGTSALHVDAAITYKVTDSSGTQEGSIDLVLARKGPRRFEFDIKEGDFERTTMSDGKDLYIYYAPYKQYTLGVPPPKGAQIVEDMADGILAESFTLLAELLRDEPFKKFLSGAEYEYLGEETVNGGASHRIKVNHELVNFDLWVAASNEPRIYRIIPDTSGYASKYGSDVKVDTSIDFKSWTSNGAVKLAFNFTPPEGSLKVPFFYDPANRPASLELLGKSAPAIKLDLLDGGTMELASHKGKDIVILDFWATWCGPCRMLMPIIEEVADAYKSQGVKLYAVNLRESPEAIRRFLESTNLDVPVAMDKTGRIADTYYAQSIPQTVIIGKDGTVQIVHVGVSSQIKQQLTTEIEALIKGRKFASS